MSSFLDFVDEKKKELASQSIDLNIDYFRNEFDNMTKLVNLFQKNKGKKGFEKGAYQTVAEIAFKDCVMKADGSMLSTSLVGTYLKIVRAERKGVAKATRKVVVVSPTVSSETVAVSAPVPAVARPGAVPGETNQATFDKNKLKQDMADWWDDQGEFVDCKRLDLWNPACDELFVGLVAYMREVKSKSPVLKDKSAKLSDVSNAIGIMATNGIPIRTILHQFFSASVRLGEKNDELID
jgi:hypothetical protein